MTGSADESAPGPPLPELPGALLSKLGHELRSPLNGVIGLTRIMLRRLAAGTPDPDAETRHLTLVLASAAQMLRTVDQVVGLARLQSGATACVPAVFDCRETVAEAVLQQQPTAAARGLHLLAEVPDTPVLLVSDARLLQPLLHELVDNAVKYADGGDVHVRIGNGHDDAVTIEVANDGPAIPADERSRIFEPFERGAAGTAYDDSAAGLGLSRELAERLDATLSLRADPGPRTTFAVELPGGTTPTAGGRQPAPA